MKLIVKEKDGCCEEERNRHDNFNRLGYFERNDI